MKVREPLPFLKGLPFSERVYSDDRLSLKAKGLYAMLVGFYGKVFTLSELEVITSSGIESIRSALKELKEIGAIDVSYAREKGRIIGLKYLINSDYGKR